MLMPYLVHTRNVNTKIYAMCKVLDPDESRKHRVAFEERVHVLLTWVYKTLLNVSGLFKSGVEPDHSPMRPTRTARHVAGFLFPRQMTILMLAEAEDMMPVLAPGLYPIFGIPSALRYPTQPLRTVSQGQKSQNIITFIKDWPHNSLEQRITRQRSVSPPMAFTITKMPVDLKESIVLLKRARAKATAPSPKEIHSINWRHDIFHPLH